MPGHPSRGETGDPPESRRGRASAQGVLAARPAGAHVHAGVPPAGLSADLGRPGRRSGGAAARRRATASSPSPRAAATCCPISTADARRDHRRRSQRRAYRAAQPEAARPRRAARSRRLLRLLRPRRPPREHRDLPDPAAPRPRRGDARLLGRARASTAAAASRRSRAAFIATACSAASSAPATPSRGSTASDSTRCSPRARSTSSGRSSSARSRRCSTSGFVRWLARRPSALYGLGIPPAQYRALAADGADGVTEVLKRRVERLACDFPVADNYFAWQAFGRAYARAEAPSLPPYLQREHFETVRDGAGRVRPHHGSFTERLEAEPDASLDAYVLLDAQDWMNDATLTGALARNPPHRAPRRARHLPHRRRRAAAARPRARRHPRRFRLRGRARARARRARPLLDLRRLPSLGAPLSAALAADARAAMDRMYRRQRHIYDLTRKFYLLGRDELIDGLKPPAGRDGARDRLRHRAQSHPRRARLPGRALLRPRRLRRDAGDGARACRRRRASPAGSRWRAAMRRRSTPQACSASPHSTACSFPTRCR